MKIIDNKIVLDLNKVQFGRFFYKNQHGYAKDHKPSSDMFSINGVFYNKFEQGWNTNECLYDRAKRLGSLDVWIPHVKFQLTANHSLIYSGDKAVALWKEWNRRMFSKKK